MGTLNKDYKAYIIHGWTYSLEKYKKIGKLLSLNGLKTDILKVPGLTEKIERPWDLADYIHWLKNKIDKEKNKVVLIGHSNGGRIALNFAIRYPQKIDRLILIDSAGIYHNGLAIRAKRFLFKNIARIGKKLSTSEKLRSIFYKVVGESDYKNANPQMKQTMINLVKSDMFLRLDKITIPTLIIWGEDDKVTPLYDAKIMNKLIKNSKLYVIKGAKHSPHFTHAEEVGEIILKAVVPIPTSHPELA